MPPAITRIVFLASAAIICLTARAEALDIAALEKAAAKGDTAAAYQAAKAYYRAVDVPTNKAKAEALLVTASRAGDPWSTFALAGIVAKKELSRNLDDLSVAMDALNRNLAVTLGTNSLSEKVAEARTESEIIVSRVEKIGANDESPALYLEAYAGLLPLAKSGDGRAQKAVASILSRGLGGSSSKNQALRWYEPLAKSGDIQAQLAMSWIYSGLSNRTQAAFWEGKVADAGSPDEQYDVGQSYTRGDTKDYSKAAYWFGRAAKQGQRFAQRGLSLLYENGRGVSEDFLQSYKWLLILKQTSKPRTPDLVGEGFWDEITELSTERVEELCGNLRGKMSADQVAQAQVEAKSFVPKLEQPRGTFDYDDIFP